MLAPESKPYWQRVLYRMSIVGLAKEYGRLCRLQYLGFGFVSLLGAVSIAGTGISPTHLVSLVVLNGIFVAWGFADNDYVDKEIDRSSTDLAERPLVGDSVSQEGVLVFVKIAILLTAVLALALTRDPEALMMISGAVLLVLLYDRLSKRVFGSEILYGASAALLFLFGAKTVTGDASLPFFVWLLTSIVFLEHLFFNIAGSLKDVANDAAVGATTTVLVLGVNACSDRQPGRWKFLAAFIGMKLVTIALIVAALVFVGPQPWQWFLLVPIATRVTILSVKIALLPISERRSIAQLLGREELLTKTMLPIMLAGTIGITLTVALVAAPFAWFCAANFLLYGKVTTLNRGF